jgi:hypothetical protein
MQLHFYVTDDLADAVKRKADAAGLTVSRYLADLVQREVAGDWPEGFFDRVVGGWQGQPLERPAQGAFEQREDLRG